MYNDPGFAPEAVFDSSPYFCGKNASLTEPAIVASDDSVSSYDIQFVKDYTKGLWRKANLLFDYSTSK